MNLRAYYHCPTMVRFWDNDGDHYVGGIAFEDKIICGCCGGTHDLGEIYEFCPEGIVPIIEAENWWDIEADIQEYVKSDNDVKEKID